MKSIGRTMQLIALFVLPLAIFMELANVHERRGVAGMLIMAVFGGCLFYLGRMVESYGRR